MYTYHFLNPEKQWGVFYNGEFVEKFDLVSDAQDYCIKHNDKAI